MVFFRRDDLIIRYLDRDSEGVRHRIVPNQGWDRLDQWQIISSPVNVLRPTRHHENRAWPTPCIRGKEGQSPGDLQGGLSGLRYWLPTSYDRRQQHRLTIYSSGPWPPLARGLSIPSTGWGYSTLSGPR